MNRSRVAAATAALMLGAAPVLATTPPASAGLPVVAHASIGITFDATAAYVCYDGRVDDGTGAAGTWLLEIEGARSNGSQIQETNVFFAESIGPACYTIFKNGAPTGAFVATLSFATLGSGGPNPVPDFVAQAVGEGAWDPHIPNSANSIGT